MTRHDRAVVFDVQRFSVHDGPGIRTVVFFKGCSLDCIWCHNPEAVNPKPELAYYEDRCLPGCRACVGVCAARALRDERGPRVLFDRCTVCGACVDACPADALVRVGREVGAEELLAEVCRDRSFYDASGGGVTLSGGEPLLHAAFLRHFLPMVRAQGLHVAVETAGAYPFERLAPLLPMLDLILFDLKVIDSRRHRDLTGRGNEQILDNLRRLRALGAPVSVRMPLVPGMNSDAGNVTATAELLREIGVRRMEILPYNPLWEAKLPRLGTGRRALGVRPPTGDFYARLTSLFASCGIEASAGPIPEQSPG